MAFAAAAAPIISALGTVAGTLLSMPGKPPKPPAPIPPPAPPPTPQPGEGLSPDAELAQEQEKQRALKRRRTSNQPDPLSINKSETVSKKLLGS